MQKMLDLPVMEAFYTIQGEGAFAGQATYFIRLAGCDVWLCMVRCEGILVNRKIPD